jgi:photosystem II stability/assembly factor-like uncharacterized protein
LDGPLFLSLEFGAGPNPTLWAGSAQGAYRADADGRRWSRIRLPSPQPAPVTLIPHPRRPGLVFAIVYGREKKRFRTVDGGKRWAALKGLPSYVWGLTTTPVDGSVYAWGRRSIFRSHDDGVTWTRLPPLPSPTVAE